MFLLKRKVKIGNVGIHQAQTASQAIIPAPFSIAFSSILNVGV
jgi:hypothetical protein